MSKFDATLLADMWEDECQALMEWREHYRFISIRADDLLALIEEWRDLRQDLAKTEHLWLAAYD